MNFDEHPIDRIYVEWANTLDSAGKDSGPARERMLGENMLNLIHDNMWNIIDLGQRSDQIKKYVYYGKESDRTMPSPIHIDHIKLKNAKRLLLTHNGIRIYHALLGLFTEIGEAFEILYRHVFEAEDFDWENFIEENGDFLWYVALNARACGFKTLDEFMASNKAKLTARYGTEWSQDAAINRDTANEMKALGDAYEKGFTPRVLDNAHEKCPRCGHMAHYAVCYNMQSDGDCDCTYDSSLHEMNIGHVGRIVADTERVEEAIKKFPTLSSIVAQLSACQYETHDTHNSIENNLAFLALRHYAYKQSLEEKPDDRQTSIG